MNLEGRLLGNRYEIIEKIGNGGMATVYKAKCHVLKRYVAVKILRDEFTTDDEFIKRFNIEAQAAASLTHPNIVSIYDVGNEGNLYYIVMELVKGKTLKEIIIEDGKLSWKWSLKVAMQIASALETAHKNNIIHRDIKPHNIIITEEGIAKVTDFGIAKAVSNSTITAFGTTIGSVHYFSPEHARGGNTDAKSDLYSLGVVMYEMVTGRVPFDADTPVSVALKHMQEEPIEPVILNPDLPISVNKIILKAMQKDINRRYNSATEMITDLNIALKNPDGSYVGTIEKSADSSNKENKNDVKPKKSSKIKEFFAKHKILKILAIILSAASVFVLSMIITFSLLTLGRGKDIQVPNLTNLTVEQAKQEAEKLSLKIEVLEEKYDDQIVEGNIVEQDPKYQDNFKIKEGATIKVIVSKGQEIVIVPKLIGKTRDEAWQILKSLQIEPKVEEKNSDDVEKGYVIAQSIPENGEVLAGSEVLLTVSTGIEQIQVPDLSGKTEADAKKAITDAKLTYKATIKTSDSSKPNGVVVNQDISAGSTVNKGTQITITINEFDEIKSKVINVNLKSVTKYTQTDPMDIPDIVELKVTVGTDTVYKENVSEDSTNIPITITGKGTIEIKVYVNDVLKRSTQFNFNTMSTWTAE